MSTIEEQILDALKEIKKWIPFLAWSSVKQVLLETLNSPEKLVAYSLTDGNTGIRHIRDKTGKSFGAIQGWWKSWAKVGIVEQIQVGSGSRAKALFDLDEFEIEIPTLKVEQIESSEDDEEENNE